MTADLNRRIENIIRFGSIAEVDFSNAKAKVKSGGIVTDWLPWVTARAGNVRTWSAPSVNEQCVILAASGELTTACVLVGLYTQNAPSQESAEYVIDFPDGARVVYNHATGALTINGIKTAHIQAETSITLQTPQVNMTGDLQVDGSINSGGDQVAGGISTMTHTHTGDSGGKTGKPS
ncbi:phage baseplate assembly protein V [Basfia succiniciproducens]|uniref:phage baseplate assembly protein V n=1 Tax=Basfia succiniciproducens TaxID=653940 RepID=UPI003FCD4040